MLRYYFNTNTEIVITDDANIKIVQNRNDITQELFENKDEAIAWAKAFAKDLNKTIVYTPEKIVQPTDVEIIQQQVDILITANATLTVDNELLKGCVMELASIIYA